MLDRKIAGKSMEGVMSVPLITKTWTSLIMEDILHQVVGFGAG